MSHLHQKSQLRARPKALPRSFFERPTLLVARELIGAQLVLQRGRSVQSYTITEVEAYDGPKDRASHAARGKTTRNAPMFMRGGIWYLYLVYGMHEMLNIVTGPAGYPAAVLIRGVQGIEGPGRMTSALGINRARYNARAASAHTRLWIARGTTLPARRLPRVGVAYAGKVWAQKPYRFTAKTN